MLKNLIASCMIASSVNLQPLTPNKAVEHTFSENMTVVSHNWNQNTQQLQINEYDYYKLKLDTSNYMYGRAVAINQEGKENNNYFYYAKQQENILGYQFPITPSEDPYNGTNTQGRIVNAGQLYIIELEGRANNTQMYIDLTIQARLDNENNNQQYYYEFCYSTDQAYKEKMETAYNLPNTLINRYEYDYNIYRNYQERYSALISNTKTTYIKSIYGTEESTHLTLSVIVQPNVKNYYVVLIQPQLEYETITENTATQQSYCYEDTDIVITIRGKNIMSDANTEIIDLPGVMFEVVGMPFTFISTAFNLTIFPGTQYSVNISNLVLTIFAILVFLFLLKIFLKMKG